MPRLAAEFTRLGHDGKGPELLAAANVIRTNVAGKILAVGASAHTADDDAVVDDERHRRPLKGNRRAAVAFSEVDAAVPSERRDRRPVCRIHADERASSNRDDA